MLGLQRFATTWLPGARESLEKNVDESGYDPDSGSDHDGDRDSCLLQYHVTGILDYPYTVNVH